MIGIGSSVSVTGSENLAQVNGATVNVGAGTPGTGTQRVVVAQDTTTVAGSPNLPVGTNIVGKVGIDQTTPGATNATASQGIAVDVAALPTRLPGTYYPVTINKDNGVIFVNQANLQPDQDVVATIEKPDATSSYTPLSDLSGALEASSVSKNAAGVFYGLSGYNTLGSAQWIKVYNSATVPANGAVTPIIVVRAAASSPFSFDTGKFGIYCSNGISWSNDIDATIFNKTIGASDCFVNLLYK